MLCLTFHYHQDHRNLQVQVQAKHHRYLRCHSFTREPFQNPRLHRLFLFHTIQEFHLQDHRQDGILYLYQHSRRTWTLKT